MIIFVSISKAYQKLPIATSFILLSERYHFAPAKLWHSYDKIIKTYIIYMTSINDVKKLNYGPLWSRDIFHYSDLYFLLASLKNGIWPEYILHIHFR